MSLPEDSEHEAMGPATLTSGASSAGTSAREPARPPAFDVGVTPMAHEHIAHDLTESAELEDEDEEVLEVEPEPAGPHELPPNGFHAFLRHANLHNLLQIESLSRTTGVFLVVSGGSRGYLHLVDGELVHAETGRLSGEAAVAEILAWEDGEFKSCERTLAPVRTVRSSLQSLLMRLAQASDEAQVARHHQASRVVRRPLDQEAPTETYLPPAVPSAEVPAPATPRSGGPPPLPRLEPTSVADVVLSAAGEVIQGRGAATEEFAARVAYAARLADLIGRAIRSGTPRALELRGKSTQTVVHWQADGNLAASLDLPQPSRR
ncbi:MAG: DUF4388 domain-containing protein [Deltaproteobacteria bacterium]